MPLKRGSDPETVSHNIGELMHAWHTSGKIGNIAPRSEAHARRIAIAAAYREKRSSPRARARKGA